jgi:hypothetical protein
MKKNSFLRPIKDIVLAKPFITGSFIALSFFAVSCDDEETEMETVYTKNVHTTIQEVKPNEFKISDEQVIEGDKSRAYIHYLDGSTEEVGLDVLQERLSKSEAPFYHDNSGNLGEVLAISAFGAMLLPSHSQRLYPPYREEERQGGGSGGGGGRGSYYMSQTTHQESVAARSTITSSRVTRPVSSSRGFFSSFRSSGRG